MIIASFAYGPMVLWKVYELVSMPLWYTLNEELENYSSKVLKFLDPKN